MKVKLKAVENKADQSILVKNDKLKKFYAPHHYHPHYEIIYIKKSYGIQIIGNKIDNYQAGEVVILAPGLPHYHVVGNVAEGDEWPIETIAVLFPAEIIETNRQFPELIGLSNILEHIKYGIELLGDTKVQVQYFLEKMSMKPCFSNFVNLFAIFEVISKNDCEFNRLSTVKYDNKKLYNEKTKHVLDHIAEHFSESLSVSQTAETAGMTKSGFCVFFKAQTGFTFSEYMNHLRISKACALLGTTGKAITEIAFEVGYENLAYFNRRFKEIKGKTPKEFRKEFLG